MLSILLLLAFAYSLDSLGRAYPAYGWAIAFGLANFVLTLVFGGSFLLSIISSVVAALYAWGYFAVLRYVADNTLLWFIVLLIGAIFVALPSVLVA